jgi:tetraprenyl-beta-curcumene synthase
MNNPTPLSARQVWALITVASHELLWGIPTVAQEVAAWRARAQAIPDPTLRADALCALGSKRFNPEGAALFAVLCPGRDPNLVRLLVAFQVLLDYLDSATERPVPNQMAGGRQLHLALVEALDLEASVSNYYACHPWKEDGGYVRALVSTCRTCCERLPSYSRVMPFARRAAKRCGVQGLNHISDPVLRERTLREWAEREFGGGRDHLASEPPGDRLPLGWWELTAAASSTLGIHALLALAADPACSERDVREVDAAYMPWICAASTMLDSYVDQAEDLVSGGHSYVAHYASSGRAVGRVRELVWRSVHEARRLRDGPRHALIVAGMAAMYLSSDDARTPAMRSTTASFVNAGGSLTKLLLPILRLWRIACAQRVT